MMGIWEEFREFTVATWCVFGECELRLATSGFVQAALLELQHFPLQTDQ